MGLILDGTFLPEKVARTQASLLSERLGQAIQSLTIGSRPEVIWTRGERQVQTIGEEGDKTVSVARTHLRP